MGLGLGRGGLLRKCRLSRATLAGLQHKEILRARKRQLASVLGGLAQGDTLALDKALSASSVFAHASIEARAGGGAPPRVRPSRRRPARIARALQAHREATTAHRGTDENVPPAPPPPTADFSYECLCASECSSVSCACILTGTVYMCAPKPRNAS